MPAHVGNRQHISAHSFAALRNDEFNVPTQYYLFMLIVALFALTLGVNTTLIVSRGGRQLTYWTTRTTRC